jgi:hypothetical protein
MVHDQEVSMLFRGHAYGGGAEIHRRGDPRDFSGVADLQAVERLGRIRDFIRDAEVFIEIGDDCI